MIALVRLQHEYPRPFGFDEIHDLKEPGQPLVEEFVGVAVGTELHVHVLDVHRFQRRLEFNDGVGLFKEVDKAFQIDPQPLAGDRIFQGHCEWNFSALHPVMRFPVIQSENTSSEHDEARWRFPLFVADVTFDGLAVPVRLKDLMQLIQGGISSRQALRMEPGQGSMNCAAENQPGRFEGFGEQIHILELVFEAALRVEIDLAARKVVHRCCLPRFSPKDALSSGWLPTWTRL